MNVEVPEYTVEDRVDVDPGSTALVIVDMQNDFVREDGKLPVPGAEETIPAIRQVRELARDHGMPVHYTQDSHRAGDPEFEIWGEHVLVGTDGWKIIEEIEPAATDKVFRKSRYDGFYGTDLADTLEEQGTETLILCGTVANICVLHTAGSAAIRWYDVIVPVDCISAIEEFDMQATLRQITFLYRGTLTHSDALRVEASEG